ncbi:MAG: twin-arginine translocase subunit TatC [Chloroflexaceae bacterium]|nr:twin-arginine translocase subunit TatC [Chloroflexaceae bacterium]
MAHVTRPQSGSVDPAPADDADVAHMSVIAHLKELRMRLSRAMIGVLLGMGVGVFLISPPVNLVDIIIRAFLVTDRGYPPVQAVGTAEAFTSYMTVALAVGFILGMPVIVYELLAFIVPALEHHEQRILSRALPFIMLFFLTGLLFGWFVTVPVAIRFLTSFGNPELIANQPSLSNFLHTVTFLLLVNGVIFEMPIIIFTLAFLGLVQVHQLSGYRRYAIVIIAIVAAVITPTGDPINLMLLALPMYLLYEFGIFLARFAPRRE